MGIYFILVIYIIKVIKIIGENDMEWNRYQLLYKRKKKLKLLEQGKTISFNIVITPEMNISDEIKDFLLKAVGRRIKNNDKEENQNDN